MRLKLALSNNVVVVKKHQAFLNLDREELDWIVEVVTANPVPVKKVNDTNPVKIFDMPDKLETIN